MLPSCEVLELKFEVIESKVDIVPQGGVMSAHAVGRSSRAGAQRF